MVTKVLVKAGSTVQAQSMMYKEVIQMMLLYVSDSWVVLDAIMKVM